MIEREIINEETLFTEKCGKYSKSLCKQSYSDGTSFWTLEDQDGDWPINYGSESLSDIYTQLLWEQEVDSNCPTPPQTEEIVKIYEEFADYKLRILNNIRKIYWNKE